VLISLTILSVLGLIGAAALAYACRRLRRAAASARRLADDAVERRFNVLEAVADGIYIVDDMLTITHVNEEAERLLRSTSALLVGVRLDEVCDPLGSELGPGHRDRAAYRRGVRTDLRLPAADRSVEVRIKPAAAETLIHLRDVTARTRASTRLEESEQRLQLVTQNVNAVLWTTGRDARFSAVTGGALGELGLRSSDLLDEPLRPAALADVSRRRVRREAGPRGSAARRALAAPPRRAHRGRTLRRRDGAVGVSIDITELSAPSSARGRRRTATASPVCRTGFRSRSHSRRFCMPMEARMAGSLFFSSTSIASRRSTTRSDTTPATRRSKLTAGRIAEAVRGDDIVGRPGGDEFIVVLPRITGVADVDVVAQRIIRMVRRPVTVGGVTAAGREHRRGALPEHGRTARALVSHADAAMYAAKRRGGNVHLHFDASMEAEIAERLTIENELRLALERGELRVHYQPIVDAVGARVSGCEALRALAAPDPRLTFPDVFLPVAEETGLIVDIDRWVMEEAIRAACTIRALLPDFGVAVNVSPRALCEAGFGDDVLAAAGRHGLPLEALTIEIPRRSSSSRASFRCSTGSSPRASGSRSMISASATARCRIWPTSDRHDTTRPLRSCATVAVDPRQRSLVRSIVALAKGLALDVRGRGGRDGRTNSASCASAGCLYAQGYWFSKP